MRFFFPATLVALATLVCLSTGFAQDGATTRPPAGSIPKAAAAGSVPNGTNVAVIDIAYIFNNHSRFKGQMKALETEALEVQGEMQARQKALQALKEGLKEFRPGTPDFQKAEEKFANEMTEFQLQNSRKQQEVTQKEAVIYYEAYNELEKTVAYFAQKNRIGIVIKFDREPIKPDDGVSIRRGLARSVIYQSGLDISNFILTELNKGQPVTPVGPGPRTASPNGPTGKKKG